MWINEAVNEKQNTCTGEAALKVKIMQMGLNAVNNT